MTPSDGRAAWRRLADAIRAFVPDLTPDTADGLVAGMAPMTRTVIRGHLSRHPDALVTGSPLAPPAVQRLIRHLHDTGVAGVRVPDCPRCGRTRPLKHATTQGRVCRGCEGTLAAHRNPGICGACGETRPRPDGTTCRRCRARATAAHRTCTQCGKPADLDPCHTCRPRPLVVCALCGTRATCCARWPLGPVCKPCYRGTRSNPGPCPGCGTVRALIAVLDHRRTCAECAGHRDPYRCRRCGDTRRTRVRGLCDRCAVDDRLAALFDPLPAAAAAELRPLREALASSDRPAAVLAWLQLSASAPLLGRLAATGRPLGHDDLDTATGTAPTATVDYLRKILVTAAVLPPRDEHLTRVARHLDRLLARHPEHALLLRPWVRWSVLPRMRRRAADRGPTAAQAARAAYTRIDTAAAFLSWTGRHGMLLEQVTQDHVDRWLTEGASTRYELRDFLTWTNRHDRSRGLDVPVRTKKPVAPLDDHSHWELLQQCLHDDELPTAVRVAGAVVLLFGQRLTRIAALTTDHLVEAPEPRLILDRIPIHVPPMLGVLLNTLANTAVRTGWALPPTGQRWLFPGTHPGEHRSAPTLRCDLKAHGIKVLPARATALVHLAQDLPPAVLADLLGMHPVTANRWRQRASTDWAAYLQTRRGQTPGPR
ncbi:hypothetical protein GCM10023205_74120 [Yinghuangia aomiensis]|uniref:Site-specific recombinase XerD n=1 Tax=Yinghuangia aomiensis TaxID=676205 RepID=A0ABP9I8Z4_9ACTN